MHAELSSLAYSPLITLMTADYLLRARDLDGWPGRFPPIDFKRLLVKSIVELSHGLYGADRVSRELAILDNIANQHGLREYFRETVRRSRRKPVKSQFEGSGVSPSSVYFDASTLGISNIFEAAHAASTIYELVASARLSSLFGAVLNSVRYRLASRGRGDPFPDENSWADAGTAVV